ncbi:MAG: hypothetical protein QM683_07080 [Lacrimispora sp.]
MIELFHQIFTPANVIFMLKGLRMTVIIAVLATVISIFFGHLRPHTHLFNREMEMGGGYYNRLYGVFPMYPQSFVDSLDLFYR